MLRTFGWVAFAGFVLLLPLLMVSIWLQVQFGATLFDHQPFYNDELFHWHQSMTFAEAGLAGGYYSLDENTPPAPYSGFYAWGMFPYVIYGTIAQVVHFPLHGVATANAVIFMIATGIFIVGVRPSWEKLLMLAFLLATFIPLLVYLPSSLLQLLNLSIALILAMGFYHLLTRPVGWRFVLGFTIFMVLAGLIRPTFALFLAPMFALADSERTVKSVILAGFKALPLVLFSAIVFYTSASPFPHFRSFLILGDDPLVTKLTYYATYIRQSFVWMAEADGIIRAQHLQFLLLIGMLVAWGIYQTWRTREADEGERDWSWGWELALHLYNLVGFYVVTILLHETLDGHDYRVMAPHLLFSLLLLLVLRRRVIFGVMVVSMLVVMPIAWDTYRLKAPNFDDFVGRQFADWRSIMGDDLDYTPDATSRWCNTVAVSSFYVFDPAGQPGMLLSLKPGLGITWLFDFSYRDFDLEIPERYQVPSDPQSQYLILTDADFEAWGANLNLQRLERAPQGAVYLNLDSGC